MIKSSDFTEKAAGRPRRTVCVSLGVNSARRCSHRFSRSAGAADGPHRRRAGLIPPEASVAPNGEARGGGAAEELRILPAPPPPPTTCVCGLLLLWGLEVTGSNLGIGMFMFAASVNTNIRSAAPRTHGEGFHFSHLICSGTEGASFAT